MTTQYNTMSDDELDTMGNGNDNHIIDLGDDDDDNDYYSDDSDSDIVFANDYFECDNDF